MLHRIEKYLRLLKYRKKLRSYLNILLHEEKLEATFKRFDVYRLPEITISDLLGHYSYKEKNDVVIKTDFSSGISPINDYYFLCLIAKAGGIKKYFEFGTWVGLSAYNMANNLDGDAEIYTLDIPEDHNEIAEYNIPPEIFGHYSKSVKNIHSIKSDSKNFDFVHFRKQFDMVFVDGNHSYEYVKNDTKIALELIKDENSVIAWHDYMILGEENKIVLAGILDAIPQSEQRHLYHLAQSNMAVYSKGYSFEPRHESKWKLPERIFNIRMETGNNNG
jgi:predicted O-methyltransferase YrrM